MVATNGRLLYLVCKQALRALKIKYVKGDSKAVLMWCDTVKLEYFGGMKPWQVINRLPWGRVMCRKAPFVRLIHRIAPYFPKLFTFLPKSYILPTDTVAFKEAMEKHDRRHIYKPDRGSLGHGIRVIEKDEVFQIKGRLAIAQEYVESFTLDNRKFDLRIYALVASLHPLRIYIYRGGVARFCTASADGNGRFSHLTNTAVNQKNPDAEPDSMTRTIPDVFAEIKQQGHNIDELWEKIDNALVLSLISAYGFLEKAEELECPDVGYPRCFQIIGCDVLLDKALNPYVLEINYRPSLKCNTKRSHDLKLEMLQDALKIGCPYQPLQDLISNTPETELPEDIEGYRKFIAEHKDVIDACEKRREAAEKDSTFSKVYPNPKMPIWDRVLEKVKEMPTETWTGSGMPLILKAPEDPVVE